MLQLGKCCGAAQKSCPAAVVPPGKVLTSNEGVMRHLHEGVEGARR